MKENLANLCINNGGFLVPLLISPTNLHLNSLTNPSIFNLNGRLLVNLRNTNYTLYHSTKNIFESLWGPLTYVHPENDMHLKTENIICDLNNFTVSDFNYVSTENLDKEPLWDFVGLEDARIVFWNNTLYLSGVRRDTTENGQGRMELSEVSMENFKEISRIRIPAPSPDESYCEKNWMPILDIPFHYVKWTNGTEIVRFDLSSGICTSEKTNDWVDLNCGDLRGGSQVIKYEDHYICLVHEVEMFNSHAGRKNGRYLHRFIQWDSNFNSIKISEQFSFMGGEIEFCCGLARHKNSLLITFGFQDNAAFLLSMPNKVFDNIFTSSKNQVGLLA